MVVALLSKLSVVAVAAAGLSAPAVAVSTASALAAGPSPCVADLPAAGQDDIPLAPGNSCTDQRQQCMSGSVQEGIYGERYVPPDAVAMCMEAYRDCINANSDDGSVG